MQYQIGDVVVYGIHGVCHVADIEDKQMEHKNVTYYVLVPTGQADAKFYVPLHNPVAVGKMRKVLTKAELTALLESKEVKEDSWIPNENLRKEAYRDLISRADCAELIRMLRALYFHKKEQLAAGKKFHQCDENFMKDAERVICSEVAAVMEIPQENVGAFIRSKIED